MKQLNIYLMLLVGVLLSSCEFMGTLIETGFWAGVIVASVVWAILIFIFRKIF
jgi:hypothetical protein